MTKEECLARAAECEQLAATAHDEETRKMLLDMAARWRRLAGMATPKP